MEVMYSINLAHQQQLLQVARSNIQYGAKTGSKLNIGVYEYDPELSEKLCCFVTLKIDEELRGCIGSLIADKALVKEVADNAYSAAFRDNRFNPVTLSELEKLRIEISILTPSRQLEFATEEELLSQLTVDKDGLIIEEGGYNSTFLPSVWHQLPNKTDFIQELKRKAGLDKHYWSSTIKASIYQTISFAD